MILVRTVMQAKFGRGGELAALFAETNRQLMEEVGVQGRWRVLTDLSGTFDTVVLEGEAENLAEWERVRTAMFQAPSFRESMARSQELIESGRNELYTIEAEG